ncbi:DUF4388 domain-containing protein [Caldithrix abyssi]
MNGKRVLIVDDEEDLTWSISKHLSRDKDKFELIAVNSGMAALDVLAQVPVDLVITDIRMPEISGLDLLLKIRENYPQTKVVIMTAYGSSEIQDEANRRGCFKYIEKPFEIQELRKLILDVLQEKKGFEGKISDFQLTDLIQLLCLGRQTNSLHFEKDHQHGVIYFDDGNIVHATVGDLEGEDAFYEILTWEGGTFNLKKGDRAPKETIFKNWQNLLLEGLRRLDELRARVSHVDDRSTDVQRRIILLLENALSMRGIRLWAIVDESGFIVASAVAPEQKENLDLAEIIPVISKFISTAQENGKEFEFGHTEEIFAQFEKGLIRLARIPAQNYYLVTLGDEFANGSLIRLESKKLIKQLEPLLPQL